MPRLINEATPILRLVIVGGYIAGLVLAALGAFLVYLGATGSTEFSFFGQTFKSTNVGIAAIFVGWQSNRFADSPYPPLVRQGGDRRVGSVRE